MAQSGDEDGVVSVITLWIGIYIACEIISNVTAAKPVQVGPIVVPAAIFLYAFTFTLLDVLHRELGYKGLRTVIWAGFAANVLLAFYTWFAVSLPAARFYPNAEAYASVLGSTPRIVVASLLAYLASSFADREIYHWVVFRWGAKPWLRVVTSNAVSTLVDSVLFISIAFVGVFPITGLIVGQYVIKMAVAVVSLPLVYLARSRATTCS
ncbi:MAG: queuosine precursor transporter [bacterium]